MNFSGSAVPSVARLYNNGTYTVVTPGVQTRQAFLSARSTYVAELSGRAILRPGRTIYWTVDGKGPGIIAAVYLEWWELTADL